MAGVASAEMQRMAFSEVEREQTKIRTLDEQIKVSLECLDIRSLTDTSVGFRIVRKHLHG